MYIYMESDVLDRVFAYFQFLKPMDSVLEAVVCHAIRNELLNKMLEKNLV